MVDGTAYSSPFADQDGGLAVRTAAFGNNSGFCGKADVDWDWGVETICLSERSCQLLLEADDSIINCLLSFST